MGRSVYADESAQACITDLINRRNWFIGLIIGQASAQKDFVLLLSRTPDAAEDEVCDESQDAESTELPSVTSNKTLKSRPKSLDKCDENWLATHAKQVTRMLPGGLDVLGIFTVAPSNMLKDSQAKLRQLVFAIHKAVTKNVPVLPPGAVTERLILQVDSLTSKIVCSSIDVSNTKSTLRPAEWRTSAPTHWLRMESAVAVDVALPVAVVSKRQQPTLLKEMLQAVSPFCHDIWRSVALVGGKIRHNAEQLATFPDGKKSKGKDRDSTVTPVKDVFHVDFLVPLKQEGEVKDPETTQVNKIVSVRGIIVSRAFVQWKASVQEAVEALKTDVVRSLCARCELLAEDLELTDETSESNHKLFDTPVRVFTSPMATGAQVCDYTFQDEKVEEVVERIQELLDLKVTPESLEMTLEHPARANDWVTASHSEHSLSNLQESSKKTASATSNTSIVLGFAISGVVAAGAAAMSYLYAEST